MYTSPCERDADAVLGDRPTGMKPAAVAFSPGGGLLAVANDADSSVSMYTVAGSGALTPVGSTSQTAASPVSVAFSATGRLLATANKGDDSLSLFSVAQTGSLTQVSGSPMPTGTGSVPQAVVFGQGGWLAASSLTTGAIAVFAPAAPSATISSPTPGAHTYALGAVVGTAFTCADSTFGPGIASCSDSGGGASPGGRLSTASIGAHTYTVTARSSDGQTSQTALGYRVAAKPSVSITVPRSGRTYRIRQRVSTAFGCREGAGGPGLVTCADSNGVSASHGRLDTTHFGRHSYSVTAISADGLQTLGSIAFRVAAAPSVTIGLPVAGAHYGVGQRVTARYGCADGLGGPGIASCRGTARRGKRINTSRAGRHRFTVVARSKDGLRTTQSRVYSVG